MLDPSSETMHKAIDTFSQRLLTLKQDFLERAKLSDANQELVDRIQQHKDRLAAKLSDAERTGTWGFVRHDFAGDWNSLLVDFETLEERLDE
jgi:hypothetical protein